MTFSSSFYWMKTLIVSIKFHWSLFGRVSSTQLNSQRFFIKTIKAFKVTMRDTQAVAYLALWLAMYFSSISIKIHKFISNRQYVTIGDRNGLVPWAIYWINADQDFWCHKASLGHNELTLTLLNLNFNLTCISRKLSDVEDPNVACNSFMKTGHWNET